MSKKPTLAAAMQPLDRSATTEQPRHRAKAAVDAAEKPKQQVAPSRAEKKALVTYFSPDCIKQLKQIALDKDVSQQDLVAEALNDLFQKHRKPTLA